MGKAKAKAKLLPISKPSGKTSTRADRVFPGKPLPPTERVRTFSPAEWESFIQEWANSLKQKYKDVMRCSGAGDMGRDIVAHVGKLSAGGTVGQLPVQALRSSPPAFRYSGLSWVN